MTKAQKSWERWINLVEAKSVERSTEAILADKSSMSLRKARIYALSLAVMVLERRSFENPLVDHEIFPICQFYRICLSCPYHSVGEDDCRPFGMYDDVRDWTKNFRKAMKIYEKIYKAAKGKRTKTL